ncbi:olfactory receptor 5B21-like [Pantherophis guttatus]|uniref:Olfactory receptor 5B21-like n=1 Tax=Pantherophis guttatus TaxID=94885 RepID=A0A6P9C8D3_PANGU|nr:olfactory receptor 5B21-like [Pantherophis guttatus]
MRNLVHKRQIITLEFFSLRFWKFHLLHLFLFQIFLEIDTIILNSSNPVSFMIVTDQHTYILLLYFLSNVCNIISVISNILLVLYYIINIIMNALQRNQTEITEFILLGFGEIHHLQIFLFLVFLVIFISTMVANFLTVIVIVLAQSLHTPMYFFLGNLACLEMIYSSAILPRMIAALMTGDNTISVKGCMTQFYFGSFLVCTECYLLSVMSYDRFLAVCKPLHYSTLMNSKVCIQLAAGSWLNSILAITLYLGLILQLQFCGQNEIDHFFCEALPLLKLSCSDTFLVKLVTFIVVLIITFPPFVSTLISYIYIIVAILKIPSTTGRQKAFSTCSSHLIVVSIFYGAIVIVYLVPKTEEVRDFNKIFSLLYTVLPPLLNPLIYSLRNKDVKDALRKVSGKLLDRQCVNQ